MRLNLFIANSTGLSRRAADRLIAAGQVTINGQLASAGQQVTDTDVIVVDGRELTPATKQTTIMLNKPPGFVCSRDGQGNQTVYDLLPDGLHHLKPVGRLDKHSSGLLLMTTDGQLSYQLTHPKFHKSKVYKIALNIPLEPLHHQMISAHGIMLDDGLSKLELERINNTDNINWKVTMQEGRNRQIRRTFDSLGYNVVKLHRTQFGNYQLSKLRAGSYETL